MKTRIQTAVLALASLVSLERAVAQGTMFTYQGRLHDNGSPASGSYDLVFTLHDRLVGGAQQGQAVTNEAVAVSGGLFTVTVDFGVGFFYGPERWLEIWARTNGSGAFVTLDPRQPVTAAPYAIYAGRASLANTAALANAVAPQSVGGGSIALGTVTAANLADGTITGGKIASGQVVKSLNGLTDLVTLAAGSNVTITPNGNSLTIAANSGADWKLSGNNGTMSGTHFLGTTDNQALELKVNNARVLRLTPNNAGAPNVIGGSAANVVDSSVGATIAGGGATNYAGLAYTNRVAGDFGTVGGGRGNLSAALAATVGGGHSNRVSGIYSTVSGGHGNAILSAAQASVIAGGRGNSINTNIDESVIGGGLNNTIVSAGSGASTISGGQDNTIHSSYATVGGGWENTNSSYGGTLAGGRDNAAGPGNFSVVGGGLGNVASGAYATVPGGESNLADGDNSLAAGYNARAVHAGAFVWADSQGANFNSTAANQVSFRCQGGVRFTSGSGGGNQTVSWTPGSASWSFSSDRRLKEGLAEVDAADVLARVSRLPIALWNYKGYAQRHIGPMAQDFHALFPLNESDTTLNDADLHGVALAAIQGLNHKVESGKQKADSRSQQAEGRIQKLEAENAELQRELTQLRQLVKSVHRHLNGGDQ